MLLSEISSRLDDVFHLDRQAEPDGWDFALSPADVQRLRAHGSQQFAETFNGVLLSSGPAHDVACAYLLVFPEESLVDKVIARERERGAPGAVILTHHPVDMETSGRGFVAIPEAQLRALRDTNIAMYVLHAPLDCNEHISTSGALAVALGLEIEQRFAPYVGGDCGVIASGPRRSFAWFAEAVRTTCELPGFLPDQVRFAGRDVQRVAIVAGGGDDAEYIRVAESMGVDTYLAGHWWTPHPGEWCDTNRALIREAISTSTMNLISGSHDGTELVVFRDVLEPMLQEWGVHTQLLKQSDHWR